jgi:hypothetical protein
MTGMRDILRPTKYSMTKTRKNPPETTRKTIPKKYTNEAKRHIKEETPVAICVSHNALAETSQNNGFQIKHMHSFSRENTKTRPIKRRKTPSYRRINIYSKSPLQYQKERQRRRKALELVSQGLTLSQIAKELGVSVKSASFSVVPFLRRSTNSLSNLFCSAYASDISLKFMLLSPNIKRLVVKTSGELLRNPVSFPRNNSLSSSRLIPRFCYFLQIRYKTC